MRQRAKRQGISLVRHLSVVTLVVGALAGGVSSLASAGPFPPGSIKLQPSQIQKSSGVTCGFVKAAWVPGTSYMGGRFLSRVKQERNLRASAKKASGTSRTALLKSATQVAAKAKKEQVVCATFPKPSTAAPATSTPSAPGASTPSAPMTTPSTQSTLKFNIKNAVGLTLGSTVSTSSVRKSATGSNLQAVDAAGKSTDAVSSGTASISKFLIAPNDKLYVLFASPSAIDSKDCVLAEVSKATGDPVCIESEAKTIRWEDDSRGSAPIQFDADGNIYYLATIGVAPSDYVALRRFANGKVETLVGQGNLLRNFVLLADKTVLLQGSTRSSGTTWLRRLSTEGSLATVASPFDPMFMLLLPDGNVLIHNYFAQNWGYKRYLTAESRIEDEFWISNQAGGSPSSRFNALDVCLTPGEINVKNNAFCTGAGHFSKSVRTIGGTVSVIQKYNGKKSSLTKVYPQLGVFSSNVSSIEVAQQVLDYLILSGTNEAGAHLTTLLNVTSDTEQTLIPATNEIEVYHLNYVASTNKIMFDGLRFSDNKYVLGQIDLNTGQVTASQTGSSKLVDFQTFGS